jgi:hypothetical protein
MSFSRCVLPALEEIKNAAGTDEDDELYSEYEVYEEVKPIKLCVNYPFRFIILILISRIIQRFHQRETTS